MTSIRSRHVAVTSRRAPAAPSPSRGPRRAAAVRGRRRRVVVHEIAETVDGEAVPVVGPRPLGEVVTLDRRDRPRPRSTAVGSRYALRTISSGVDALLGRVAREQLAQLAVDPRGRPTRGVASRRARPGRARRPAPDPTRRGCGRPARSTQPGSSRSTPAEDDVARLAQQGEARARLVARRLSSLDDVAFHRVDGATELLEVRDRTVEVVLLAVELEDDPARVRPRRWRAGCWARRRSASRPRRSSGGRPAPPGTTRTAARAPP